MNEDLLRPVFTGSSERDFTHYVLRFVCFTLSFNMSQSFTHLKCFLGSVSSRDAPENGARHHPRPGGVISMPQSAHHLAGCIETGDRITHSVDHPRFGRNAQTAKGERHPTYHRKALKGWRVYRECPVVTGWGDTYSAFSVQVERD